MARRSILSDEVRLSIVERLAVFDSPQTVAAAVKNEFGIVVSRQAVEAYDPTRKAGQRLSPKLRELFYGRREAFRRDIEDIPVASKAFRLRVLGEMVVYLRGIGNCLGAAQLLEQAAKEVGGVYVGRGGGAEAASRDGPTEPQDIGADRLAEIGERFARGLIVVGGRNDGEEGRDRGST